MTRNQPARNRLQPDLVIPAGTIKYYNGFIGMHPQHIGYVVGFLTGYANYRIRDILLSHIKAPH